MAFINKMTVSGTTYDLGGEGRGVIQKTWSGTAPSLTQAVVVPGMPSDANAIIDIDLSIASDLDAVNDAWSKIWRADSSENTITFYAKEATSIEIPFRAKW